MNEWDRLADYLEETPPYIDIDELCHYAENECASWLVQHNANWGLVEISGQEQEEKEDDRYLIHGRVANGPSIQKTFDLCFSRAEVAHGGKTMFAKIGIELAKSFYGMDQCQ